MRLFTALFAGMSCALNMVISSVSASAPEQVLVSVSISEKIRHDLGLREKEISVANVYTDKTTKSVKGSAAIVRDWTMAHIGENRVLFIVDTAEELSLSGDLLVFYLDTDNNSVTGRTGNHEGVDVMLIVRNNTVVAHSQNAEVEDHQIYVRGRVEGKRLYLVMDTPLLNKAERLTMTGYIKSEGTGKKARGMKKVALDVPLGIAEVAALPDGSMMNLISDAGFRYVENRMAYESLQNKGMSKSDIQLKGYTPPRTAPLPLFDQEGKTKKEEVSSDEVEIKRVAVFLKEEAGIARSAAEIKFGFPLPEGRVFQTDQLSVEDENGKPVDAGIQITAYWPDNSIKWTSIRLRSALAAEEEKNYTVVVGGNKEKVSPTETLEIKEEESLIQIHTGKIRVTVNKEKFNGLERVDVLKGEEWVSLTHATDGFVIRDEAGTLYSSANAAPTDIKWEEKLPGVSTLRIAGSYASANGDYYMSYVNRMTFYAGSSRVDMTHTHVNTQLEHEFSDFRSIEYELALDTATQEANVLLAGEKNAEDKIALQHAQGQELWLFQANDLESDLQVDGKVHESKRLPGGVGVVSEAGSVDVALTDFWQRWPKGIQVKGDRLSLRLLPEQPSKEYGKDLPYYLMYPFVDGFYRLKWGMSFTERMVFEFGVENKLSETWAEAQWPVLALVPASWYAETEALIPIAEPQGEQFSRWDDYIQESFSRHMALKDNVREYGFLNYGDWFGERGHNWGNNEYDLPHTLFSQYARTGNRDFYRFALIGARHQADVDIVHAYPDPFYVGANHKHSVGHTGQWSSAQSNLSWSYEYGHFTAAGNGHTWADGMVDAWLLAVDPVVMESALKLGDHMAYAFAPQFDHLGTHERSAGWSMRALIALYRATSDPVYLKGAEQVGEVALIAQDMEKTGVWPHELPASHASGAKGIHGNNLYLIGVLSAGLLAYHDHTGDERYQKSLLRVAEWMSGNFNETIGGWPYSVSIENKPVTRVSLGLNGLIYNSLLYGALLDNDAAKVAQVEKALLSMFVSIENDDDGKNISMRGFFTPETLGRLQKFYKKQGLEKPAFLSNTKEALAEFLYTYPVSEEFSVRAPDHKKFRIVSEEKEEIFVERRRHGSMPRGKESGVIRLSNAEEEIVFEHTFSTLDAFELPVTVPAAGEWYVDIEDDQRGVWSVSASTARVDSVLIPDYRIGAATGRRYLFDVPEGTSEFRIEILAVHPGGYGIAVLNPKGEMKGYYRGRNVGETMLEFDNDKTPQNSKVYESALHRMKISVDEDDAGGQWSFVLWARGDMGLQFQGIPAMISIQQRSK